MSYLITSTPRFNDHQRLSLALKNNEEIFICPLFLGDIYLPWEGESRFYTDKKLHFRLFYDYLRKITSNVFLINQDELLSKTFDCTDTNFDFKELNLLKHRCHLFVNENFLFHDKNLLTKNRDFTSFRKKNEESISVETFESALIFENESIERDKVDSYFQSESPYNYFETRNDFWGDSFSTKFSIPLAQGLISPQYIWSQVESLPRSNKSTYWIQFELLWREYFHLLYKDNETLFFAYEGLKASSKSPILPISLREIESWCEEHEFTQAALNQLKNEGFLSNRVRQIFASYWVHHAPFEWRYGAYLFQYYLKDYSTSANWGNWLYLAGVGTDPRGLRYFNIEKQFDRYDPERSYLRQFQLK